MEANGIVLSPDPRLRQECAVIEEITPAIEALAEKMKKMMFDNGGCGLAAPQIGELIQLVTIDCDYSDKNDYDPYVLINPVLTRLSDAEETDWEGCLSVPGLRGQVPRWQRLRYQGVNELGQAIDRTVEGFHARVVQHECDHLQGMLYPMRMRDFTQFGFTDVLFTNLADTVDE